jgi:hypothetical protein
MNALKFIQGYLMACSLIVVLQPLQGFAQQNSDAAKTASQPAGHIEGLTLRLYNPQTHQWSLYWANSKAGTLNLPPNVGEFRNGRGEFFSQDTLHDRVILVRYVWSDITPNSVHFEQSFSDDGGKTWEVNWISSVTRAQDESHQTN